MRREKEIGDTQTAAPLGAQSSAAQSQIPAKKEPVVDLNSHRSRAVSRNEDGKKDAKKKDDDRGDAARSLVEARFEGTHGQPVMNITPIVQSRKGSSIAVGTGRMKVAGPESSAFTVPDLKKRKSRKSGNVDTPPTPRGCQWLKADDGWNLWRYWTEKDPLTGERIRKTRYAGFLSQDAWQIMKDYDYETFISIIGQRLRRYGQR